MTSQREADEALIEEFLKRIEDCSGLEIGRLIDGVTQNDVSRWRRGEWDYIQAKKRRAVKRFLGKRVTEPLPLQPAERPSEREEEDDVA